MASSCVPQTNTARKTLSSRFSADNPWTSSLWDWGEYVVDRTFFVTFPQCVPSLLLPTIQNLQFNGMLLPHTHYRDLRHVFPMFVAAHIPSSYFGIQFSFLFCYCAVFSILTGAGDQLIFTLFKHFPSKADELYNTYYCRSCWVSCLLHLLAVKFFLIFYYCFGLLIHRFHAICITISLF